MELYKKSDQSLRHKFSKCFIYTACHRFSNSTKQYQRKECDISVHNLVGGIGVNFLKKLIFWVKREWAANP